MTAWNDDIIFSLISKFFSDLLHMVFMSEIFAVHGTTSGTPETQKNVKRNKIIKQTRRKKRFFAKKG